jgi:hypothetical protein
METYVMPFFSKAGTETDLPSGTLRTVIAEIAAGAVVADVAVDVDVDAGTDADVDDADAAGAVD